MPADELDKARQYVTRADQLIHRLEVVLQALERSGQDTEVTRILLNKMYRCHLSVMEDIDWLERPSRLGDR